MSNKIHKPFYKSFIWYYHLCFFLLFLFALVWGLYVDVFKEHWYTISTTPLRGFIDFDILLSFLSVQINIVTIVWMLFYLLHFHKRNYGVTSYKFRIIIMNWNFIVFITFWVGILFLYMTNPDLIHDYTRNQIICTTITHFIAPLSLMIIYCFAMGYERYAYCSFFAKWDLYIALIYPFSYVLYVLVRAQIYQLSNFNVGGVLPWPYPFLDFDHPFIEGTTSTQYFFILITVFALWITVQHFLLICVNNLSYRIKNR